MSRTGFLICLLALTTACGRTPDITYTAPTTAFFMRGTVKIAAPGSMMQQSLSFGRVNIRLYRETTEGYCLAGGSTILADVVRAVPNADLGQLVDKGQSFYFSVVTAPGMTFPLTVYPVAEWQTTQLRDNACERDTVAGYDHYNARGAYQPTGDSACCEKFPAGITILSEGQIIENVDFTLDVRNAVGPECADPAQPFNRCIFKQTACEAALGERAPLLLQPPNGGQCG